MKKNIVVVFCLFSVLTFFMADIAMAAYPAKPVVLVTHSSPGAGGDIFLRNMAKHMEPYLGGASLAVENKAGGGGAIALNAVATSRPDGYTLLGVTPTYLQTPLMGQTARNYKDTTAVVRVFIDAMVLYVKYDSPFKNIQDILDDARKNPGKQRWAASTLGSVEHMIIYQMQKTAKISVVPVTFEGGGDTLISILGGHLDLGIGEPGEIMGQVDAKKIRLLAVFNEKRLPMLPDVPTMKESGNNVVVEKFRGLVGPKGVPAEVISWWEGKVQQVLKDSKYKSYYESVSLIPSFMGSKDFTAFIERENGRLVDYLKDIGMLKGKQ